jgi:hypothetical protein
MIMNIRLLSLCLLLVVALSTRVVEGKKTASKRIGTPEELQATRSLSGRGGCKSKSSKRGRKMKKSKKGKKECKNRSRRNLQELVEEIELDEFSDDEYELEYYEYDVYEVEELYEVSCADYDSEEDGPLGICETCELGQFCCVEETSEVFDDGFLVHSVGCAMEDENANE